MWMRIDDTDFEELLTLLKYEDAPSDPTVARHAVEKFVDLVELLARPLPLPPPVDFSLRQPSSGLREQASVAELQLRPTQEV